MENKEYIFYVKEDKNERIDVYLSSKMQDFSRSFITNLAKKDGVFVNGKKVLASYRIKSGDNIKLIIEEKVLEKKEILPENIEIDIIYEDDDVVVVNKKRGMVVHPAAGNYTNTLVNALMYRYKNGETYNLSDCAGTDRLGIVHRLDKDTSGLIVCAKNNEAHKNLSEQLKNRTALRKYVAIVSNNIKDDFGVINKNIARGKNDRKKMFIDEDGKEAVTEYKVLKRFAGYTFVECNLKTGRTHQIRVHLKSIGNPIVGDILYSKQNSHFKTNGQLLHSLAVGFNHPKTGKYMEFKSEIPNDMLRVLEVLEKR